MVSATPELFQSLWEQHQTGVALRQLSDESGISSRKLRVEWKMLGLNAQPRRSDPTEEEIRQATLLLKSKWSRETEQARWVGRKRVDGLV